MHNELFYREIPIEMRGELSEDKREIDVSFSSETLEVQRWFGIEVLSHEPGAIDMSVLRKTGSHLFNHNPDRIIGPIRQVRLEDNKGRAILGYDQTEEGELAMVRTKNKSLRGVSVAYRTLQMKRLEPKEEYQCATKKIKGREDVDVYVITKWQPREISSTPIPADSSVGLGRDLTRSLDGIQIINRKFIKEVKEMDDKEVVEILKRELPAILKTDREETIQVVLQTIKENALPKMLVTPVQYQDLMGKAGAVSPDAKIRVADMIGEGRTNEECISEILKIATKSDAEDLGDGPGPVEIRGISFKQLDDDSFFSGLAKPSTIALDTV